MGRSQETFNKKDVRSKKEKKRKEKAAKRLERKENKGKKSLDDMIAYVDEFGRITDTPPDPNKKTETKLENIDISVPKSEDIEVDSTKTGIVSFFNDAKGFGFIRDSITRESVFVHINNVVGDIKEGNKVSYETERGPKGMTAVNVSIIR